MTFIGEEPEEEETESSTPGVAAPPAVAVHDDTKPFSLQKIDEQVQIRYVEGKGRELTTSH